MARHVVMPPSASARIRRGTPPSAFASAAAARASPAARRSRRAQASDEMAEVDHAVPGGGEGAVRRPVLGMGHGDAVAPSRSIACGDDACAGPRRVAVSNRLAGSSTIFRRGERHLVDQAPRLGGGVDDVGELGLDAEVDAVASAIPSGRLPCSRADRARPRARRCRDGARHWSSGSRVPVHSVISRCPCRGAAAARTASRRWPSRAHRRVGMDHVVGAGHGDDLDAGSRARRRRTRSGRAGRDRVGHAPAGPSRPC